ncbi:alanine racemase [Flavivirga eckloniae]|uniref:Alanine racemase n=1 Tax=Flavivirga eckloniae TaxID=1803846 RepID=A0A2K9PTX1_9FLAO|nr:alanine racemase [Flavivirga eckloniae]AUP80278.1 alanine racemase [Flavivirga eckloniae]
MITKPTLLIDEFKCKQNIANMFARSKQHHVTLRPHFKTHQSLEIGQWFKNVGVTKITVSSLDMASYFAKEWQDITVAFPVNILEIDVINTLVSKITLNILVEHKDSLEFLEKHLTHKINFYIKINIGNNRAGLRHYDLESIESILAFAKQSDKLNFIGFLGHAGQTYKCRGKAEILSVHYEAKTKLVTLKEQFKDTYPNVIASYGDTPSCSISEDFSGIDEIRPGNFALYDVMQAQIGSCELKQIAVAMVCPIVAIHPKQNELIIYGGGVHFSKDSINDKDHGTIYGLVVHKTSNGWGDIIPNTYVCALSQEHGIVKIPKTDINNYKIGDTILVLPIHSCMTANLMKAYYTLNGQVISMQS